MSNFYTYVHIDPRNNLVRYVGKGMGKRAYKLSERRGHHRNWIQSLKFQGLKPIVKLIENGLTEQQAFDLEKLTIAAYRRFEVPLTNLTAGGEGVSGGHWKLSDKTKHKMSKAKPENTRKKMGVAQAGNKKGAKQVIDLSSGVVFDSAKEAAESKGIKHNTLICQLSGKRINKTQLRYVKDC